MENSDAAVDIMEGTRDKEGETNYAGVCEKQTRMFPTCAGRRSERKGAAVKTTGHGLVQKDMRKRGGGQRTEFGKKTYRQTWGWQK